LMHRKETTNSKNLNADVVIIGAGGAGLAAALTLFEKGCQNVVVLEKSGIGGNSAMTHDLFAVESPVQRRMGTDARRDDFFKKMMAWAHWATVNPRIVRAFIDKSGDTIRWLQEKGLEFNLQQFYINQSPRVSHTIKGEGKELMKVLARACTKSGIRIFTQSPCRKVFRDDKGIIGILAEGKGEEITVAVKSIIIASGGYAWNRELLEKHCAFYNRDTVLSHGVHSNTGDGIQMAIDIGAATAGLGHLMLRGPSAPSSQATRMKIKYSASEVKEYPASILIKEPQTIWVNKKGERFIDEGHNLASFASGVPVAQQPDGVIYTIFDDHMRQDMEEQGINWPAAYGGQIRENPQHGRPLAGVPLPGLGKELRHLVDNGISGLKIAQSLDEIADWIGAKTEILLKTVEEYNVDCKKEHDSIFCKDPKYLIPLHHPPYYALRGQSIICDAVGGIKINERMEVLDNDDNPIPGLFAAGSTTGCWETESYCYELTGHMLGFALNSGRIAGENAAQYIMQSYLS
jgi:fumarate reductase flavoprotein subunit